MLVHCFIVTILTIRAPLKNLNACPLKDQPRLRDLYLSKVKSAESYEPGGIEAI